MNKYTFSAQSGKAYYCNSIPGFIKDSSAFIVGQLVRHSFEINKEQSDAWDKQIHDLQTRLNAFGVEGDIIFEYDIVRLGKRIDVILLIRHVVFSLEFKNGKTIFTAQDAQQAEDYAIDIKNFHKESEDLYVCPILIATDAPKYSKPQFPDCYPDKQIHLQRENNDTLVEKLLEIAERYGSDEPLDFEKWIYSPYHPTPTIIDAAVEAYTTHDISEIANSEAGQDNINDCEKKLDEVINYAKTREVYVAYRKAGYSKKFLAEHEADILLHKAAKNAFDDMGVKKLPTVKSLQTEYAKVLEEKKKAYAEYRRSREEMRELLTAKANVDRLLNMEAEHDTEKEKDHAQR